LVSAFVIGVVVMFWMVFGASAASKVRSGESRRAFVESLRPLCLLPDRLVRPVAVAVTCVEIGIFLGLSWGASGLVAGVAGTPAVVVASLVLAVGLLVVLTGGIALALARGTTATCACFGASDQSLSRRHVIRNGVLLLAALTGAVATNFIPVGHVEPLGVALAGVSGTVAALVLVRLDDLIDLFAPVGGTSRARS
jgi:hypothetical protein